MCLSKTFDTRRVVTCRSAMWHAALVRSLSQRPLHQSSIVTTTYLASYPGLLTPAFVASSTNTGKGLAKLSHVQWVPGHVEEWHIPRQTVSKRVHYWSQTWTVERLSAQHQRVLATFLGFRKLLYSCTEGMCHSSTHPGMWLHVTQLYQAFPHVSTANDECWREKAWVRGYYSSCPSTGTP